MLRLILLSLAVLSSCELRASELHLLEVKDLSVEYWQYDRDYRNSYLLDSEGRSLQLRDGGAINLNLTPINWTYMDNIFHMANDIDSHPRYVGWKWEAGIRLGRFDVFREHHSQHGLEYENPRGDGFPLENSVGIRIRLIGGKEKGTI